MRVVVAINTVRGEMWVNGSVWEVDGVCGKQEMGDDIKGRWGVGVGNMKDNGGNEWDIGDDGIGGWDMKCNIGGGWEVGGNGSKGDEWW